MCFKATAYLLTQLFKREAILPDITDRARLGETQYSEVEEEALRGCLASLWGEVPAPPRPLTLPRLLAGLTQHHRDRLPRLLASCLLYSARYSDTQVHCKHRIL